VTEKKTDELTLVALLERFHAAEAAILERAQSTEAALLERAHNAEAALAAPELHWECQQRIDALEAEVTHFNKGAEEEFSLGDPRAHAAASLRTSLADFSRNGRWGTCGQCPSDGYGRQLPEKCLDTERADHQLDVDALARRFKQEVSSIEESRKWRRA